MEELDVKRFEAFLGLLSTHRPECPVNGLVLAIPVESLLSDSEARMQDKAVSISNQLAVIQKNLVLRFPIYLFITKSDQISGFREYFNDPINERFAPQIVGWSNPEGLESIFDPKKIPAVLKRIATRLSARRFAILSDPVPRDHTQRRADEVDRSYTFPNELEALAPKLQKYLEILFSDGEWTRVPPFFRGIYFTSSMQEGEALDQEMLSAVGQDRALFLKDIFVKKNLSGKGPDYLFKRYRHFFETATYFFIWNHCRSSSRRIVSWRLDECLHSAGYSQRKTLLESSCEKLRQWRCHSYCKKGDVWSLYLSR